MTGFKVGDSVRITEKAGNSLAYWGIKVGDICTVIDADNTDCPYEVESGNGGTAWVYESYVEKAETTSQSTTTQSSSYEKLTLGQVIDRMQLDEVAIVVERGEVLGNYANANDGIYFDIINDNVLTSLSGCNLAIQKRDKQNKYHIIKREVYDFIVAGVKDGD